MRTGFLIFFSEKKKALTFHENCQRLFSIGNSLHEMSKPIFSLEEKLACNVKAYFLRDNLHKMSKLIFMKKISSAEIHTQHAER